MLTAIIVAGGSSRRMGFDKTFASLGTKPAVAHTVAAFEEAECVDEIILVGRSERIFELEKLCLQYAFRKVQAVIAGGVHRQDSVSAGFARLRELCCYVAVHDAARPLVTPAQIARVFEAARVHGAAALAEPVTDTLKRANEDRLVCGSIDREGVYAMQTPQIFSRDLLLEALQAVRGGRLSMTDEVSAVEYLGREVVLVANTDMNLKITYPTDLAVAELVLNDRAKSSRLLP